MNQADRLQTLFSYFVPQVRDLPILGLTLGNTWLWTLNPSPAYIGQGIIMGPTTTTHMLFGAIFGWAVLSPLAKSKGWAPGPVNDWGSGSKGWIVWVSLAIMLADSLVSLGWLIIRPLVNFIRKHGPEVAEVVRSHTWKEIFTFQFTSSPKYRPLHGSSDSHQGPLAAVKDALAASSIEDDAPPQHLISTRTTLIGLVISIGLSIAAVHVTFTNLIPIYLTILAMVLALLLSIMGVRALGETDLNPVSGISKLTQLIFAFTTPTDAISNPNQPTVAAAGRKNNAVIINLVAGALSESGALQAGDLLQDLKTGHLLYASPKAQFWGQLIGSAIGAIVSALVYRLYTQVYEVPGGLFEVPAAYVWVFTARLVLGDGLPPKVAEWAAGCGAVWAIFTAIRVWSRERRQNGRGVSMARLIEWALPGGIAVAVGMYNSPSFTLARAIGGFINLWWRKWKGKPDAPIIVLASGLVLGEGLFSIVNLALASIGTPHL
jgi:OPT family oligopeptide transporter